VRALLLLVAASGCWSSDTALVAQPAQPASPPQTPYDQLEARMPPLMSSLVSLRDALENAASTSRCDLMAKVLRQWGLDHRGELDELGALRERLTSTEREHFDFEHADDMDRIRPIRSIVKMSCDNIPEVESALELAGFQHSRGAP
jgi:hypothetical protein